MKIHLSIAAIAAIAASALAAIAGCGSSATLATDGEPVKVLSASPSGQTYFSAEPVRIHFDRPVVAESVVGKVLDEPIATITPPTSLSARFVDRQTLVLTPDSPLAASTRYHVRLVGDLAKRTGDFELEFISNPLEVEGVWGIELTKLGSKPELPLHFNQLTSADAVAKHCRFLSADGSAVAVTAKTAEKATEVTNAGQVITISPTRELTLDASYQLICSGLSGVGGSEPMAGLFSLPLRTRPALTIAAISPDGKSELFADRTRITVEFSNPMKIESLRKNIRVTRVGAPADADEAKALANMGNGWLNYDATEYTANVELDVKAHYQLTIDGELTDSFGQKLGADKIVDLRTGNARPTISMETGIYALEASKTGYPIWTRNIGEMSLKCAEVPTSSVVKLLTSGMDYDPWYNASKRDIKWTQLGLGPKSKVLRPAATENKWHLSRVELGKTCGSGTHRGLFLAEIRSPDIVRDEKRAWAYRPMRRVLANVTDIGILLKAGPASGLVWVTSISTGKPMPGASVEVFSTKGKKVFSGRANKDGLVMLPGTSKLLARAAGSRRESYRSQRMITVVRKGSDMGVVDGNWANGIQTWNFGVDEDRTMGLTRIRGFIQSDRGIYRPGETVKFKGLLREYRGARAPIVPKEKRIAVTITNSRGASVHSEKLPISRFGGFDLEYAIGAEAPTGDYLVTAKLKDQTFRERFTVEEFRKVTFEIDVDDVERHQRLGQRLTFNTKTNYLFGAPVKSSPVKWDVQRRPHTVRYKQFPSYGFADYAAKGYFGWWWYDGDRYPDFVESGAGKTDGAGRFSFSFADKAGELDEPQDYIAQLTVTDQADQAVTKRIAVTAHPTEFYLGLHAQEWVQAVGMPFAINAVAVRPGGEQIARKAKLSVVRENRICTWKKRGYRSYPECKNEHVVEASRTIDIPATGAATEKVFPKKPGDYIIRIETTDNRGKKVASSTYVWVLGKGQAFWSGDESARMTLIASKTEYAPGETARIVPRTGLVKPTALVTLERNGIIKAFVKEMESPYEGIEVPLAGSFAPNVFASVAMVSGRQGKGDRNRPQFKMGVVDLRVASDKKRLTVEVKTEREHYQPGETVRGTITVRSGSRPVVSEVAVSAADEGVLQLIGYKTPDPMKAFYKSWGLGIDNGTNWNRIARLNAPAGADPESGGDSGSSKDGVRSKFVNSAYWAPALVTNRRGQARFEFTAPDNLSAFRIMAVAADRSDRFGSSDSRVTIKKPLLAKPVLPRFLTEGDKAEVGVIVHNYTEGGGVVTVTAKANGAELTPGKQTVRLAAGGSQRVAFYATAKPIAAASFQFNVAMGKHRDGVRLEVPISRPLVKEDRVLARGVVGVGGSPEVTVPIRWPAKADNLASSYSISIDRVGLSELEPSLRSLIEYPYGCLEQTLSRFIPLTKVADLASSLELEELTGPRLEEFLAAGAAKVVRHQTSDGNYSLWPGGRTYPHLTAYATYGLRQAKTAGVKIDERAYQRGIRAIRRRVSQTLTTEMDYGTAAMSAYLLAETDKPDTGLIGRLYSQRRYLPQYGRAFLLMAMHHAKTEAAMRDTLRRELVAAVSDGLVREKRRHTEVMGSDVRSSAILLSAMILEAPRDPVVETIKAALVKAQKPSGAWGTTQENLYGLVALSDYARSRSRGSADVAVTLDGKPLIQRRINGRKVITINRTKADGGAELRIKSRGRLTYTVRSRAAIPVDNSRSVSNGFELTRRYLDPETNKEVTAPKVGQILVAEVKVKTSTDRHWVALVDPLPAGIEPLNTKLATSQRGRQSRAERDRRWRDRWDHIELRDGEARAFKDFMRAGETTLTYRVRVSMPGQFTAMPAHIEQMYEPEIAGRTTHKKVVVKR